MVLSELNIINKWHLVSRVHFSKTILNDYNADVCVCVLVDYSSGC